MDFTREDYELINREFESLRVLAQKRCATEEQYQGVIKAFEFANEAHKGVRRRSGEPYILHPIAVAKIVVEEIGLGYKSIVTALLHDIVEDTEYTVEDISRLYGEKIASLVDGLTKIKSAMDYNHSKTENSLEDDASAKRMAKSMQAENFKRILLTLNDDVRVILIKLADRLHNLRTISSMPERKRDKILSETMYIFIPLAHRLGLYKIKSEMENIWLQYREPDAYAQISKQIEEYISDHRKEMEDFKNSIQQSVEDEGYKFHIFSRIKAPYSIWRKMKTKGVSFNQIYDIYAVRIVFEPKSKTSERNQCWDIHTIITEGRTTLQERLRNWVDTPKSNGYEALHCTIMTAQGTWVEVQIRSERMNEIAEKGIAAHWSYKGVSNSEIEMDVWLNKVRATLENPDVNALEFLDEFRNELIAKQIYVFTPNGESKSFPYGATALDYAYEIHSNIGNCAIAAKINRKLVPLSSVLKNGDVVEIVTSHNHQPEPQWLNFVKTQKAKSAIYSSLKKNMADTLRIGQEKLEKALDELGLKPQARILKKIAAANGVTQKEELYNKIATGLISLDNLESVLKMNTQKKLVKYWNILLRKENSENLPDEAFADDLSPEATEKESIGGLVDIKIDKKGSYKLQENGESNSLTYRTAKCCRPIPGDKIIGFIDDNGELVVHKKSCVTATELAAKYGDRVVTAEWTKHTILSFLARIEIRGFDRIGIVNDITEYLTNVMNINMRKIYFENHDGVFEGYIELYVHNTADLDIVIKRIQKIESVESVIRTDASQEK